MTPLAKAIGVPLPRPSRLLRFQVHCFELVSPVDSPNPLSLRLAAAAAAAAAAAGVPAIQSSSVGRDAETL